MYIMLAEPGIPKSSKFTNTSLEYSSCDVLKMHTKYDFMIVLMTSSPTIM